MYRLILFLKKIHLFVLFIAIELGAIIYFSHSSVYTNAKMMNVSNFMIGGVYTTLISTEEYVGLKERNEELSTIIASQLNEIERLKSTTTVNSDSINTDSTHIDRTYGDSISIGVDSLGRGVVFSFIPAKIINNSISKQYNYITMSKGSNDGVEVDMAIIYNNSIVGFIAACSDKYSVGVSVLNRDFKSSGKDINNGYFGSLIWDGVDYRELILNDIPKYAQIAKGDTIVTTSFSPRFPENLNIGVVEDFELTEKMSYRARVKLFTDISNIYNVILIKNSDLEEITELEQSTIDNIAND